MPRPIIYKAVRKRTYLVLSTNTKFLFIGLVICILMMSCTQRAPNVGEKIVGDWLGNTIQFPTSVFATLEGEPVNTVSSLKEYKVLVYTDSLGCTSCKLRMGSWKQMIQEMDALAPGKVDFLFWFHPQNDLELNTMLKNEHINHPVFIDHKNEIDRLNSFPEEMEYQSFLLDKNNKVVLVGNPTLNTKNMGTL